jgi:hypothetical protein
MKRLASILIMFIMIMTVASCKKDSNKRDLITISQDTPIVLISCKGIVLNNDTVRLRSTSLKDFISRVDTISSKFCTKYSYQGLTSSHMDSPPPGYTGDYIHQPDDNYTYYYGVVSSDSIEIRFSYSKNGIFDIYPSNIADSLVFNSIEIKSPRKATVNNNVSIGDDYSKLFQFYKRPNYYNDNDVLRKEYSYDNERLIFKLDNNTSSPNYGKIIGIIIR